jgi:hypothetical protein
MSTSPTGRESGRKPPLTSASTDAEREQLWNDVQRKGEQLLTTIGEEGRS